MILFTVFAYIVVVLLDQVQTYKNGHKKDFYVSCAMCLLSFTVALLLASDVKLPSPSRPIEEWVSLLFGH
ncbi:hypothetical protein [uncultured Paenibacillus sp.]|uniref:hypothetical protein n=1 Tax=uncultured Paenibacillus sp. TaxID=227322 RepID=UPI0015B2D08B|nr:hypothetical protein [uncultured Paenibacillus sp.]